jgi:hypothetical protein
MNNVDKLKVVEFDAQWGKWWFEAASNPDKLKHAHGCHYFE